MKYYNRNIIRLTLLLAIAYALMIAISLSVPAIAAVVAHAKWLPGFIAGLFAGYRLEVPNRRERIYGVLLFAALMAIGWTVFNAVSLEVNSSQTGGLWLLVAAILVSLAASLSSYLGVILGMHLAAPAVSEEMVREDVDAELREFVDDMDPDSEELD